MRFRLEATADELRGKGEQLVRSLAEQLQDHNPELAENLEKALPKKEPSLKYQVLRQLHQKTAKAYAQSLDAMVIDIDRVLRDQEPKALRKAEPEEDPDFDPETGEPIFDPKTGMTPTETAKDKEEHPEDYETEETEKSVAHGHEHGDPDYPGGATAEDHEEAAELKDDDDEDDRDDVGPTESKKTSPEALRSPVTASADSETSESSLKPKTPDKALTSLGKAAEFVDHTEAIAQRDDRLYQRAKQAVMDWDKTVIKQDFDNPGRRYYGWSTNQLIEWLKDQRA